MACGGPQAVASLLGPSGLHTGGLQALRQPRRALIRTRGMPTPRGRAQLRCSAHGKHTHHHSHEHGSCGGHHGEESHSHEQDHSHDHDHSHEHSPKHQHESSHTHSHDHEHEHGCGHGHGCGHDHGGAADLARPAHRLLKAAYDATRLTPAAAWLESSTVASIGKVALFLLAAGTAGWTAAGWAPTAAAAAAARQVSLAATAGVYLLAGLPAAVALSYDLTAGKVDTHVLMNLAVLGTLATGHALEGALLLVLFQTSHTLEHVLTEKAQGNLATLYDSMPKAAVLVQLAASGGPDMSSARRARAADVAVGELMLVKPGEQIPLDGEIVHGRAMVSAEHITGESLPFLAHAGDEVAAGSLNRDGVLVLRALRRAEESTPARIAKLTLDAQAKRPQLRTWLDEFGEWYSKAVVAASVAMLAVLVATGVPLLGAAGQRGAFYRAMGLLTVASPCALVMVPLAYVSAIAAIASRGILVKGGRVLDALAGCRTVAFDKTGTLTTGALACTSMRALGPGPGSGGSTGAVLGLPVAEAAAAKRAALSAAVALSMRSSHHVSDAVVLHGQGKGIDGSSEEVADFQLVAGGGVQGTVSSGSGRSRRQHAAAFGSLEFVSPRLTQGERAAAEAQAAVQGNSSVLSVLVLEGADGSPASSSSSSSSGGGGGGGSASSSASGSASNSGRSVWVLSFEDSVRQQSATAVRQLQTGAWTGAASQVNRLAVTMLTGDNDASAQRIARKLGIASVKSALSPEQKLEHVQQLSGRSTEQSEPTTPTSAPSSAVLRSRSSGSGSSSRRRRGSSSSSSASSTSGGGGGVIMVGDGINDAPALAAADVGVAIASSATAAASLAADVIVVSSSGIAAVPLLLCIAKATQAVIRQNLILAAGSILALALPTVLGWVPLWFAVMLHEGSTLLVALNSLRLLRFSAPPRRWQQQQAYLQPAAADSGAAAAGGNGLSHDEKAPAALAAVPPAA